MIANTKTATVAVTNEAEIFKAAQTAYMTSNSWQPLDFDTLMTFCETQMRQLDGQIEKQMASQKNMNTRQQDITAIQSMIKGGKGAPSAAPGSPDDLKYNAQLAGDGGWNNDDTRAAINGKIDDAEKAARDSGDTDTVNKLESVRATLNTGDSAVSAGDIKTMFDGLDQINSSLHSNAEMSLMDVQSLMSHRTTQLQLVTNMINSMNEGMKAIATNVGH